MSPSCHGDTPVTVMYEPRTYRSWASTKGLVSFTAVVRETDLRITACSKLEKETLAAINDCRRPLEEYIKSNPPFLYALKPYPVDDSAPLIVKQIASAAMTAHVGPMAAVAGAVAESVGNELLHYSPEIIVENGGDIFLRLSKGCRVGIYAGEISPFTNTIALEIQPDDMPLGICTSSGTIGHSLSLGQSDAVVVLAKSTALADAAATGLGNRISTALDISSTIEYAQTIAGLSGVLIIKDDKMGLWGNVKVVPLPS